MRTAYLGPVKDIGRCVKAGLLEAAVQQGIDQDEGQDEKKPEDKSDTEHSDERILRLLRVVQVAEHHLDLDAHGGIGDDQDGEGKEEEDKVEGLLWVFSFNRVGCANNCARLRVLLQHHPVQCSTVHAYSIVTVKVFLDTQESLAPTHVSK